MLYLCHDLESLVTLFRDNPMMSTSSHLCSQLILCDKNERFIVYYFFFYKKSHGNSLKSFYAV